MSGLGLLGALPWPALADASEVTRWKWISAPAAWVTFLVVLGALAFTLLVYFREYSPAGRAKRVFLALVRTAALVSVFVLLAELVETTTRQEVRPSWVVVMIDESVSMTLKDRFADRASVDGLSRATGVPSDSVEEHTRLDLVKRALAKDGGEVVRGLVEKNKVKVYTFASRPLPVAEIGSTAGESARPPAGDAGAGEPGGAMGDLPAAIEKIQQIDATGPETAIGDSLNKVVNETRGQHVAGIVLITDGRSNSGVLSPLKVARRLRSRGIPVFTVGVGNPAEPKDIALADLQAAEVVIDGDILPVRCSVKAQGFEGPDGKVELEVVVKLNDKVVKAETVVVQGGGARQEIAVHFKPEEPGEYTLTIETPPRPGELIEDNNRLAQRLRVIDKKIKVLYVDSLPRYEFRYLRWGLIRDKNMEAHTYLISADPEFVQDASPGLSPLGQVPSTREELFQYHVIILGDVDPHDPQMGDERLKIIREFVEDHGGGLLVIAGQHHMPRSYAGTPIESLLPIAIETGEDELSAGSAPIVQDFRPKLTLDGRKHPIMKLENDPEASIALWERRGPYGQGLPGFFWFYRPKERKKTAEILAVHPEAQTTKQEPIPIFAIQVAGAGTTFFSGTDDVWRWRAGVADRYTYRFWGQAIRYLSTGRLLKSKRFSITTDKSVYDLGEKVTIAAEVKDRSMKPATEETQTVFLEGPDGAVERIELTRAPQTPGRYEGSKIAGKVGTYKVWISSGEADREPGTGPRPGAAAPAPPGPAGAGGPDEETPTRVFQVQVPILEKSDPKMDEDLLRQIAKETRGQHFRLAEIAEVPKSVFPIREVSEVRVSERELWDRWWVLCAIVGLLCVEWVLRKWWKML